MKHYLKNLYIHKDEVVKNPPITQIVLLLVLLMAIVVGLHVWGVIDLDKLFKR